MKSIIFIYLFYYCISDIVIYLIYIDLMRKRCQLINVDVNVHEMNSTRRFGQRYYEFLVKHSIKMDVTVNAHLTFLITRCYRLTLR